MRKEKRIIKDISLQKFGIKFPVCVKTLYKWIYLGFYGFLKQNLRHRGKKYKTKGKFDNRDIWTLFFTLIL